MTSRLDISNQLEQDFKKIDAGRGYNLTPADIRRGLHKFNDFEVKPALAFALTGDEPDEDSDGRNTARWLNYMVYGYTDTSDMGNSDDIYKLLDDVEDFLLSTDNTYQSCTEIGEIEIIEGGVGVPINFFSLIFRIAYYS